MTDIAVIGGGIAGLTAAIYCARAGKNVTVFEGNMLGGQIVSAVKVENYPGFLSVSGADLADSLRAQAFSLGALSESKQVTGITVGSGEMSVICGQTALQCRRIVICTGTRHRKLGLENEERLTGHGVSYCAGCDGAFYNGRDVAVVGGGNSALDDALYLSGICRHVTLIHRRDTFRGEQSTVSVLERTPNVDFLLASEVTGISGEEVLTGITVRDAYGGIREICCDGLFVQVGRIPQNSIFQPYVELDREGYIITDSELMTATEGVYAAGDCRSGAVRQLVCAAADGARIYESIFHRSRSFQYASGYKSV